MQISIGDMNFYEGAKFLALHLTYVDIMFLAIYRHLTCQVCGSNFKSVVMCGDINMNLICSDRNTDKYKEVMKHFGFTSLINSPTFQRADMASCIDHVWVFSDQMERFQAHITPIEIADHKNINIFFRSNNNKQITTTNIYLATYTRINQNANKHEHNR